MCFCVDHRRRLGCDVLLLLLCGRTLVDSLRCFLPLRLRPCNTAAGSAPLPAWAEMLRHMRHISRHLPPPTPPPAMHRAPSVEGMQQCGLDKAAHKAH